MRELTKLTVSEAYRDIITFLYSVTKYIKIPLKGFEGLYRDIITFLYSVTKILGGLSETLGIFIP